MVPILFSLISHQGITSTTEVDMEIVVHQPVQRVSFEDADVQSMQTQIPSTYLKGHIGKEDSCCYLGGICLSISDVLGNIKAFCCWSNPSE